MRSAQLRITPGEEPRLLAAMRDIQEAVAAYYAETALGGELGGYVRTWLGRVQTLNDLLTNQLSDNGTYAALFDAPKAPGVDLINGVKYAGNVDQHVIHIVAPLADSLVGGALGYRVYAEWEPIPAAAHASLRLEPKRWNPSIAPSFKAKRLRAPCSRILG